MQSHQLTAVVRGRGSWVSHLRARSVHQVANLLPQKPDVQAPTWGGGNLRQKDLVAVVAEDQMPHPKTWHFGLLPSSHHDG